MAAQLFLLSLLRNYLDRERALPWFEKQLAKFGGEVRPRDFYLSFSACPRFIPRSSPNLTGDERREAERYYPNFGATEWTLDQLSRIYLSTLLPEDRNQSILDDLFATADYHELIALYKGLYFLPNAREFVPRAREGSRTNMTGVFDALALDNPYPFAYLPDDAWNQLVLKAMFMQRPMYRIYRIEDRKTAELAAIFLDYAEERWSAHRPVSPELWRFVAGFVDDRFLPGLRKTLSEGTPLEQSAALLAIRESDFAPATKLAKEFSSGSVALPTWEEIGRKANPE